ncbi:MAG: hypothetical protein E6Q53_01145 [Candidatus Moraniibacteriota bacterium]|nr:MAG: hypothetical protein E6Q53_01145 [Candidatus Moranbacteria bacterium]
MIITIAVKNRTLEQFFNKAYGKRLISFCAHAQKQDESRKYLTGTTLEKYVFWIHPVFLAKVPESRKGLRKSAELSNPRSFGAFTDHCPGGVEKR